MKQPCTVHDSDVDFSVSGLTAAKLFTPPAKAILEPQSVQKSPLKRQDQTPSRTGADTSSTEQEQSKLSNNLGQPQSVEIAESRFLFFSFLKFFCVSTFWVVSVLGEGLELTS